MRKGLTMKSRCCRALFGAVAIVTVGVLAVGGVQAASSTETSGDDLESRKKAFVEQIGATEGQDVAKRKYGLFSKDDAKVHDSRVVANIAKRFPEEFTINDIRRVAPRGGATIYVAAGRQVCLSVRANDGSGSDSCTSPAGAAADRPLVAIDGSTTGEVRVTGLVPMGIDEITVETTAGIRRLRAEDNIATGTFAANTVRGLSYRSTTGQQQSLRVSP